MVNINISRNKNLKSKHSIPLFMLMAFIQILMMMITPSVTCHGFSSSKGNTNKSYSAIPVPFKSGYIPIDNKSLKRAKNKMFYIYFDSRATPSIDPLIIWLEGGPGCSSLFGATTENGPIFLKKDKSGKVIAIKSKYSWNSNANVLYVDNPLGTGFSILKSGPPVMTEEDLSEEFALFLKKWLLLPKFSSLLGRDLYITGESYAGHYIPWITVKLLKLEDPSINIKGIALGNGLVNTNI